MTLVHHIQSEVYVEIDSNTIDTDTGYIKFLLTYYDQFTSTKSRLGKFQYSLDDGSTWNNCTQVDGREVTTVTPSIDAKTVNLYWDAARDIGCCSSYSDVMIRVTFYDRETGGTESDAATTTISTVDFRAGETDTASGASDKIIGTVNQPKLYDPYLDLDFTNPTALYNVKMDFVYEIATDIDFTDIIYTSSTVTSYGQWVADSLTFPDGGIDGISQHDITFDGDAPTDVDIIPGNDYYYRIRIVPVCPIYREFTISANTFSVTEKHGLETYPWVWFKKNDNTIITPVSYKVTYTSDETFSIAFGKQLSSEMTGYYINNTPQSVSVSNESTKSINHGLGYNPFFWFKNQDGEIETANQFEVEYTDTNNATVNFYENRTGTLYYDLGDGSAPNSVSVTSQSTKEITHNLGKYPWVWFKDNNNILQTPANYDVEYSNMNKLICDFIENFTGTIYYR